MASLHQSMSNMEMFFNSFNLITEICTVNGYISLLLTKVSNLQ